MLDHMTETTSGGKVFEKSERSLEQLEQLYDLSLARKEKAARQ